MDEREMLELAARAAGLEEWGWMAATLTHVVNNTFVYVAGLHPGYMTFSKKKALRTFAVSA